MNALLLAKCLSSFGGTVPLNTNGVMHCGRRTTASHQLDVSDDGVDKSGSSRSWCSRSCAL